MARVMNRLVCALGRGLVAGLVGTAAMTVSSTLEAKLSGRGSSTTPADAVGALVEIKPTSSSGEQKLNTVAHWGYGISWGVARGILDLAGLRGPLASLVHFVLVFGAEQAILPALGVGSPTPTYGLTATATDVLHHTVYTGSTGAAYDLLTRR